MRQMSFELIKGAEDAMTVMLYTFPSCTSCRKARRWLAEYQIDYIERNILTQPLNAQEIKEILRMTESGTDDIISRRSQIYQELALDLNELSLEQLIKLIERYPSLLRRPILMDEKRLQIGFNEVEIRRFLPRRIRVLELQRATIATEH